MIATRQAQRIADKAHDALMRRIAIQVIAEKVSIFIIARQNGGGFGPAFEVQQQQFLNANEEHLERYRKYITGEINSWLNETLENMKNTPARAWDYSRDRPQPPKKGRKDFDADKWLFDINKARTKLAADNPYFLEPPMLGGGEAGLNAVGMGQSFNVGDPLAIQWMATHSKNSAWKVTQTFHNKMKDILKRGLGFGQSIPEMRDNLLNYIHGISAARAELIARTEVLKASNLGYWRGMVQSGVVEGKQWLATADRETCPHCAKMDGATMPLEKPFFKLGDSLRPPMIDPEWGNWVDGSGNWVETEGEAATAQEMKFDYEEIMYPPLHPDCRCTLLAILKEAHVTAHAKPRATRGHMLNIKDKKEALRKMQEDYLKYYGKNLSRKEAEEFYQTIFSFTKNGDEMMRYAQMGLKNKFPMEVWMHDSLQTFTYKEALAMANKVEDYLHWAPKWQKQHHLYRGMRAGEEGTLNYTDELVGKITNKTIKTGDTIKMDTTSHWSSEWMTADEFDGAGGIRATRPGIIYELEGGAKNAASIQHMSHFPLEGEVAVSKDTIYKITKIKHQGDHIQITLKEVKGS